MRHIALFVSALSLIFLAVVLYFRAWDIYKGRHTQTTAPIAALLATVALFTGVENFWWNIRWMLLDLDMRQASQWFVEHHGLPTAATIITATAAVAAAASSASRIVGGRRAYLTATGAVLLAVGTAMWLSR